MAYSFTEHRYNRKQLLLVVLACGIMGTVAIISSFAASVSTITGTMWQDNNRNGVVDAGEGPFSNRRINLYEGGSGAYIAYSTTDASGHYTFTDLADGNYTVTVDTPVWWDLRHDWVPTTGNSLKYYAHDLNLAGTAAVDVGLRQIVRSADIVNPLSTYVAPTGLRVNSYVDVLTAREIYDKLATGTLFGKQESPYVTVDFGLYEGNATSASTNQDTSGLRYDYSATSFVSYISWLDSDDRTLFHEYGHAWSLYYAYIVQQDPTMVEYQKARGVYGDARLNSAYEWTVNELIAEDYRQLFGTANASSGGQINNSIPLAKDVPGLKPYLSGLFMTADKSAPSAPRDLTGTSADQSQVKLTWTASTDNLAVTSYDIYRNNQKVTSVSGATTAYTDSNLTVNTSYSYSVQARDAAGNTSPSSNTITVKTLSQPPSAPTNLKAGMVTDTTASLSWTASTDNVAVTAYDIYRGNQLVGSVNAPSTTYFDSGLFPSTSYSYSVRARDAAGNQSAASTTLTITTKTPDTQAPTKPTNFKATTISATSISFSWTPSTDNIGVTSYTIYKVGSSTPLKIVSGTTAIITGLTANTQYSFYVTASDQGGNQSSPSATIKVRTGRK